MGYGDDSIAQVGGAHVACEWVSNVLTKVLQRGRLAAYLEQSTRYIPYDQPLPESAGGGHRFYRDGELGPDLRRRRWRSSSRSTRRSLAQVREWAAERWPRGDEPEAAWERSIKAKALDLLRGLLPAATLSHVGIFASGQAYEQLLLRMLASPLPEARHFATMILEELKKVMPSFVARVERPDRGGEWVSYLERRREAAERWVARMGLDRPEGSRCPLGRADRRRGLRGRPDRRLAVRVRRHLRAGDPRPGPRPAARRAGRDHRRPGRRSAQPPPPPRPRLGGGPLPLRDRLRLRRLPRPAAPPDADLPVAAPQPGPRRRDPGRGARGGRRLRVRARAGDLAGRVRAAGRRRDGRRRALCALPRLPDPLPARPERPRGDAPDRAALRPRGTPDLPRRRPGDARADRLGPSRRSPRR